MTDEPLEPTAGIEPTADEKPHAAGASDLRPGQRVGNFVIREQIGQGGFATVYLAEQTEPIVRRVALKIIKLGMDSREVLARFEAERQALAMMDHEHVARVFDAGMTPEGRPFFVMEHVAGEAITTYCDRHKLSVAARLELFIQTCEAVQHAHQKGIIHRDIKPSNVLVSSKDGSAGVKVIDFGVAKALHNRLTDVTIHTVHGQFIGTPEYMSPEQAEMGGHDVDSRSDIYSLGVLLYELLTGATPFESERLRSTSYAEIQRIIRDEEPPKPSTRLSSLGESTPGVAARRKAEPRTLARRVRGELDWIVMRAMDKDRTRRYETANGLVADIKRYLADEPVDAGPPSASYRMKKFLHRNRVGVVTGAAVFSALVVGLTLAIFFAARMNTARLEAVESQKQLETEQERLQTSQDELRDLFTRYAHPSLAVLPLENLSGDESEDFFALGMTRSISEELGKVEALHVKSFDSTYRIADSERSGEQIASDLAVNMLLRGSVVRAGEQVRLDLRLVHGDNGESLWSDSYEGRWSELDVLQREVSADIAGAIQVRLTPQEQSRLTSEESRDPAAREAYYKGLHKLMAPGQRDVERAIEFFDEAIEIDPEYAAAYAGKARAYISMLQLAVLAPQDFMPQAKAAALKAIDLDPTLPDAWAMLGQVQLYFDWDWDGAERSFRRGLELNPNSAEAHLGLAAYNTSIGEFDLAIEELRTAVQLDPATLLIRSEYSYVPFHARRLDVVIEFAEQALELDEGYWETHAWVGLALAHQGRFDEALLAADNAVRLESDIPMALVLKASVYALAGETDQATAMLDELLVVTQARYTCPYEIATVFIALGRQQEAIEFLRMAYDARSECMPFLGSDLRMDPIRDTPEFQGIMDSVGSPYRGESTDEDGSIN